MGNCDSQCDSQVYHCSMKPMSFDNIKHTRTGLQHLVKAQYDEAEKARHQSNNDPWNYELHSYANVLENEALNFHKKVQDAAKKIAKKENNNTEMPYEQQMIDWEHKWMLRNAT
jgi:hypothetical protein